MQSNYLKRLVIPGTIALLVIFCIHLLFEMVKNGAMNGNCGCFGQLIPMTPLEAFVKNIITIAILIFLYRKVEDQPRGKNNFSVLLLVWLLSTLFMFVAFPFCPCAKASPADQNAVVELEEDVTEEVVVADTIVAAPDTAMKTSDQKPATDSVVAVVQQNPGPPKVKSRFTEVNVFSGKKVNLNQGKKIVCFFAPGCDHCQEAAKTIKELSKNPDFPSVYIYFMDEETHLIPNFFKVAEGEFPYRVLDIPQFWTMIGSDGSTPGVFYLWNGNIMKYWVGIDDKAFKKDELLKELQKK
jgi:thiol-disulfide isomerase/thioredoxin